jgi:hyperosmotically inducible protein
MLNRLHTPRLAVLAAALVVLTFAGCDRRDDSTTAGQKVDAAIAKVDEKADAAKAELARDADKAKQAVVGAAQTGAAAVEDTAITAGIKAKLATDADLKTLDVRVETTSGRVTLRGSAPNADSQARATQLAAAVSGVTSVDNQLTVLR